MNWYIYCKNNPLKYVDPNGLEGCMAQQGVYIDYYPTTNNVIITVNLNIYGPGTQDSLDAFTAGVNMWGGQKGKYNVKVNVINSKNGLAVNIHNNKQIESHVTGDRKRMTVTSGERKEAYGHEFGHFLGNNDKYSKPDNSPLPGWEGNIMTNPSTLLSFQTLEVTEINIVIMLYYYGKISRKEYLTYIENFENQSGSNKQGQSNNSDPYYNSANRCPYTK